MDQDPKPGDARALPGPQKGRTERRLPYAPKSSQLQFAFFQLPFFQFAFLAFFQLVPFLFLQILMNASWASVSMAEKSLLMEISVAAMVVRLTSMVAMVAIVAQPTT